MGEKFPAICWLPLLLAFGCQASSAPQPVGSQGAAMEVEARSAARPSGPARILVGPSAHVGLAAARIVVRGTWGEGAGQMGKRDEASRPGPMAISVDRAGTIHLLDQVNHRVQRYTRNGSPLPDLPGVSETTEDIALHGGSVWALVFEPGSAPGHGIALLGQRGPEKLVQVRKETELVTGFFMTGPESSPDIWVEQRQDTQVRVMSEGTAVAPGQQRERRLGRPNRGIPGGRVTARLTGSHQALVMAVDLDKGVSPLFEVVTPIPLVAIQELTTDEAGAVYIGLFLGKEGGAPEFAWEEVRKVVVAWRAGIGHKVVEMAPHQVTDMFRPVAVSPDGGLYQLQTTEQEVLVRRWDAPLGEVLP